MGTSSINSLLSSLTSGSTESLSQLLGESDSSSSSTSSPTAAIQDAVNAILNSATSTAGSGIDVTATVDAILQIDAVPEQNLQNQVTALNTQTTALQAIQSHLAALQTSVQALSDPAGVFSSVDVTSTNNDVVSATAASGASVGTHSITVSSLATTAAYYSKDFSSASAQLPTGTFNLYIGTNTQPETIPVDSADNTTTLTGLAAYINQHNLGVTASVVTDTSGTRLTLLSNTSGTAGALHITDNTGTTDSNAMGFTQATDGLGDVLGGDAVLTVDGVPFSSSTNTVTGAIPGVTLTLSGVSTSPVTLSIQPDLTQVSTAINSFVSAYNQMINDINTQNTYDGTQSSAPPLIGDPSLDLLQSQLLAGITASITGNNGLVNLQSMGIQLQTDGTLSVASSSSTDSLSLSDALNNNFAAVKNLFQSASNTGVAQVLNTSLYSLTSTTTGPLALDMAGIKNQVSDLNSQISDFQDQLKQTQTQLLAEYSTINTTLEQMPQLIAQINSQLDALNPSKSS